MNRSAFLVPAMLALLAGQATAQCLPTFPKFTSGAGAVAHDQLGLSVAFSFGGGNFTPLMVVGKPNADSGANVELGGFIAYRKDSNGNWVQMQEFINTSGAVGERLARQQAANLQLCRFFVPRHACHTRSPAWQLCLQPAFGIGKGFALRRRMCPGGEVGTRKGAAQNGVEALTGACALHRVLPTQAIFARLIEMKEHR